MPLLKLMVLKRIPALLLVLFSLGWGSFGWALPTPSSQLRLQSRSATPSPETVDEGVSQTGLTRSPWIIASKSPKPATPSKSSAKPATDTPSKTQAKSKALSEPSATLITIPNTLPPDTQLDLQHLYEAIHESEHSVQNDVRDEEELSAKNLAMLWQAAVERSATIRYAIEKLSKRDATGKPVAGDPMSKRMLQSVIHLGGVAGTIMTGSPAGVLGGGLVQEMLQSDPQDPLKVKVSDADMLILAKEVEALQAQLMTTYYTCMHKQQQYALAQEAQNVLHLSLDKAIKQNNGQQEPLLMPAIGSGVVYRIGSSKGTIKSSAKLAATGTKLPVKKPVATGGLHGLPASGSFEAVQPLMESLVDGATRDTANARQAYLSSRDALALMVGPDAMQALDQLEKEALETSPKVH